MNHNYRIKQSDNKALWYVLEDDKIVKICHSKEDAMLKLKHMNVMKKRSLAYQKYGG